MLPIRKQTYTCLVRELKHEPTTILATENLANKIPLTKIRTNKRSNTNTTENLQNATGTDTIIHHAMGIHRAAVEAILPAILGVLASP